MYLRNLLMVLVIVMCVGCDVAALRTRISHEIDSLVLACDANTFVTSRNDEGNKRSLIITCTVAK